MKVDVNPYRKLEASISPREFEIYCKDVLNSYAQKEGLHDYKIEHDKKIKAHDGKYQIDILVTYTAFGVSNTILVECKKLSRSVERAEIEVLNSKLQSLAAQKGIVISTTGFQSGATSYAKEHGIALWQICDNVVKHICNSISDELIDHHKKLMKVEQYLPKYFVMTWDCDSDYPHEQIYPTNEMFLEALEKARRNGDV